MSYKQTITNFPHFCVTNNTSITNHLNSILASGTTFFNTHLEQTTTNYANGKYTAPVKGLYYIEISLCCVNNSGTGDDTGEWGVAFKVNSTDTEITRSINDNPENYSTLNVEYNTRFSTIVRLNVGGYVRVYATDFTDAQIYTANRNYFMGYLVAAFNDS
jgi:hypothetical protein